ncbi:hypothetical protein Micbo1qcDRAFT_205046 [Microdochium bolleyi]|uniref:Geranylgeranyl pyrophosphate synthetase n=1 Tax=Microdochium bolleyi TaxID=196109 RepID=A0A136J198_9PEZI|nr:hypothetical protein Micbo1qcDRAFT_205046 [Microdochium bolleyi]
MPINCIQGRGGFRKWPEPRSQAVLSPAPPLGAIILDLRVSDLKRDVEQYRSVASISACDHIGSYNWLDTAEPTVLIPGMPAQWMPLKHPRTLRQDDGKYFRDRNGARYPKHPLEPAVVTALSMSPELNVDHGIELVACASTVGNLLRFVRGEDKAFRMLVEEAHGSVFLTRRENSPTELIPDVYGYGHTFPEAYTTWAKEVKGSASHHRILKYKFGGLNCLVRYETDGFVAPDKASTTKETASVAALSAAPPVDLPEELHKFRISSCVAGTNKDLRIQAAGHPVAEDRIFELKTRSAKKAEDDILGSELPRLWVTQISRLIVAFHKRGLFDDIRELDTRARVADWERDNTEALATLAALLHFVREQVRGSPNGKLELCCSEPGKLEVRKQLPGAGNALSSAVRSAWGARVVARKKEPASPELTSKMHWAGSDDETDDFTACSDACGYCGRCS